MFVTLWCYYLKSPTFSDLDVNICSNSVYINSSILHKSHQTSVKVPTSSVDETSIQPLPTLFRLLGLVPFKKVLHFHNLPKYPYAGWNLEMLILLSLIVIRQNLHLLTYTQGIKD